MSHSRVLAAAIVVGLGASCLITTELPDPGSATGEPGVGGAGGDAGNSTSGGAGGRGGEGGTAANTGGAGGGNGGGGQAPSLTPVDWTPALTAVYLFEETDLGTDSSPNGLTLLQVDNPGTSTDAQQGLTALQLAGTQRLESGAAAFMSTDVTFGAWINTDIAEVSSPHVVGVGNAYYLKHAGDKGNCYFRTGVAVTTVDGWPRGSWHHVVCKRNNASGLGSILVDGSLQQATGPTTITFDSIVPFRVGSTNGYSGSVDEVFFADAALTDDSIKRIFACGVDGGGCACDPSEPTSYTNCGSVSCDALPPCNAAAPTLE